MTSRSSRLLTLAVGTLEAAGDDPSLGSEALKALKPSGTHRPKPVLVSLVVVSTFQKPPQKRWLEGIFLGKVFAE